MSATSSASRTSSPRHQTRSLPYWIVDREYPGVRLYLGEFHSWDAAQAHALRIESYDTRDWRVTGIGTGLS